jgi:hypothetical protein
LLYYLGGKSRTPPELMVHDSLAISFNPRFTVAVGSEIAVVPETYALEQNYPNPFNPSTTIAYQLPAPTVVSLKVYTVLGEEVATLVNGREPAGRHTVRFDAARLASGVYFCRLVAGTFAATGKMVVAK